MRRLCVNLATSYRPVSTGVHGEKCISDNKLWKSHARPRWSWPGGATVTNMTYPVLTYRQLVIAAEPLATRVDSKLKEHVDATMHGDA